MKDDWDKSANIKPGELKNDPEFRAHAVANQWAWPERKKHGWPWKQDVFEYVEIVYCEWLGKGLVQADLRVVDRPLYAELHKRLYLLDEEQRRAILDRLNLPTVSDARLMSIEDPEEQAQLLTVRKWYRNQRLKNSTIMPG